MNKKCFDCHYGGCLNAKTNLTHCSLFKKYFPDETANGCEDFIPTVELDSEEDIEFVVEYNVHHTCPFCGAEYTLYNADGEGHKIIECEECGKKYSINWCLY